MKKSIVFILILACALLITACGKQPKDNGVWIEGESETETTEAATEKPLDALTLKSIDPEKLLTVFFDPRGDVKPAADVLTQELGCQSFELVPVEPYPEEEAQLLERADNEYANVLFPALEAMPEKANEYTAIIVVFPELDGNMPMAVRFFLESFDLRRTALLPVCVCENAEPAYGTAQFKSLMTNSPVYGGLELLPGDDIAAKCGEWVLSEMK